jgi:hypothetical protein
MLSPRREEETAFLLPLEEEDRMRGDFGRNQPDLVLFPHEYALIAYSALAPGLPFATTKVLIADTVAFGSFTSETA